MVNPILVAAPVILIPTFGALWFFLRRYEDYFQDARVFGSLVLGFFMGLFASFFELRLVPFQHPDFVDAMGEGTAFIFFVAGYAFFEAGMMTAGLGYTIYRERKDTPFYGLAVGLGFGAMAAIQFIGINLDHSMELGRPYEIYPFITMALVAVGSVLVHGAVGVWVGKASAEGKLWKGWGRGALFLIPLMGAFWIFWPFIGYGDVPGPFPGLVSVGYGIGLLAITQQRVLDQVVPKDIRDKLKRALRRERRAEALGRKGAEASAATVGAAAGAGVGGAARRHQGVQQEPLAAEQAPDDVSGEETVDVDAGMVELDSEE